MSKIRPEGPGSLDLRIQLLTRSVEIDSHVKSISNLAKSLALKWQPEQAKEQMSRF